jgi:hypothetical protein
LSVGSELAIFQHCSKTLMLIIVINNSKFYVCSAMVIGQYHHFNL